MIATIKVNAEFDHGNERRAGIIVNDHDDIDSVMERFREIWRYFTGNEKENSKMKLKFKKLTSNAILPKYAHQGDSGMDVCSIENAVIQPNSFVKIRTGLAAEIPDGYEIQVRPRSGLAAKNGIVAAFGTVDSGYRGEIGVTLFSSRDGDYEVFAGERIAQLVLSPVIRAEIEETDTLDDTERGQDGFGSTGR